MREDDKGVTYDRYWGKEKSVEFWWGKQREGQVLAQGNVYDFKKDDIVECGLDSSGFGYQSVCCEHGNENLGFMKYGEILEQQSSSQILQKDSAL